MTKNPPKNLQTEIQTIDAGILTLLDKRMRLNLKISKAAEKGLININQNREREELAKLIEQNKETIIPDEKLLEIWGKIIEIPKDIISDK